ncbi:MAG: Fur family transcriptional regulator [Candidatus Cloacimonetes bacterium]|nr:Fur family transcriptional regulator [Candidatus Cloacimonadota bacterium]
MIKDKALIDNIKAKLKQSNLKITPQRVEIYSAVLESGNHPTADKVYKIVLNSLPGISFDTVNRTLISFAERGIFSIVEGYSSSRSFDHILEEHHHFRCIKCNKLFDCHQESYNNLPVPNKTPNGFIIKRIRVIIEGICKDCSDKQSPDKG